MKTVKNKKHYYRLVSYIDGSGYKHGIVMKYYTEEQAKQFMTDHILIKEEEVNDKSGKSNSGVRGRLETA